MAKEPVETGQIRLRADVLQSLRAAAAERDLGPNLLAERAITHYLARLRPVDDVLVVE